MALQVLEHRPGAASQFKHVLCIRFCFTNELGKVLRWFSAVSHHSVIKFRKNVVGWHTNLIGAKQQPPLSNFTKDRPMLHKTDVISVGALLTMKERNVARAE